jgi:LysM repeat protein
VFDDQRHSVSKDSVSQGRGLRLRLGKRCAPVLTIAAIAIVAPLTAQEVTVRRGDTLSGISRDTGVPIARIVAYNGIHNPNLIYEGQVVRIPPQEGEIEHTVVPGDTLGAIARRYGSSIDAIVARNAIADPDRIVAGRSLIVPPAGSAPSAPAPTTAAPVTTAAPASTPAPTTAPTTAPATTAAPAPTTAAPTTAAPTTAAPTTVAPTTAAPATTTAPAPAPGAPAPGVVVSTIWLIQQGDTVTSIAAKVGVTPQRLADANSIAVTTPLVPGRYLFVPQR